MVDPEKHRYGDDAHGALRGEINAVANMVVWCIGLKEAPRGDERSDAANETVHSNSSRPTGVC